MMKKHSINKAFTLIELLVSVSVVGILGAITVASVGKVRESAYKTNDITSARQIVNAYQLYANDHNGRLLASVPSQGYLQSNSVLDYNGIAITQRQAAERYVFRLLPYVEDLRVFYPGPSQEHLEKLIKDNDVYEISISPSFGLNQEYIGGYFGAGRYTQEDFPVALTTIAQSPNPSQQIVVASAWSKIDSDEAIGAPYKGYFRVAPPNGLRNSWLGDTYDESDPSVMGYNHLRYEGHAVVGNLDGSVELLNKEQLSDMRRWSYQAQLQGNENFIPARR